MALYSTLASLSQTAASNAADGSVDAPSTIDQQLNLLASFIAQIRDANGFTTGIGYVAQCRLVKSGSNIVLQRFNGTGLTINGVAYAIPSAGVSLAPTGLTPSTLYYIYAYMNSTTMTLEASATGHSTDSTTGIEIKTGDATRTLVGMVRPITGPAFADTSAQRFVVSWFNRRRLKTSGAFTSSPTTTSTGAAVELQTGARNEFLTWGDESLRFSVSGGVSNSLATAQTTTAVGLDGTTALEGINIAGMPTGINNQLLPVGITAEIEPSEGYHYVTILGAVSAGTGSWSGAGGVGARTSLQGATRG